MADCSRGWGARCANAKEPACNCACNGRNHGTAAKLEADRRKARFTERGGGMIATKLRCENCARSYWPTHAGPPYLCDDCYFPEIETLDDLKKDDTDAIQ